MIDLEDRPCPICSASDESVLFRRANVDPSRLDGSAFASRKLPEYMHFRLLRCARCDIVYASPAPRGENLHAAYRDATFDAARESSYAARTYFGYLRGHSSAPGGPVLDIGAGDGAFLRELLRHGYDDVLGYEPSHAPLAAASGDVRARIRCAMFDGSGIADNSYRLVTCFQTIEHVAQPLALLREIHRVLAPDGTAFLVAHDVEALSARVLGSKSPIFDIEHYQLLNRRSARLLMTAAGFHDVRVFAITNAYPLAYWIKLVALPAGIKRSVLTWLASRLKWLGDLTVALPAGNLGIIATK